MKKQPHILIRSNKEKTEFRVGFVSAGGHLVQWAPPIFTSDADAVAHAALGDPNGYFKIKRETR